MFLGLPKRFWRHCYNVTRITVYVSLAQMAVAGWNKLLPIEHYGLIEFGFYLVIWILSSVWWHTGLGGLAGLPWNGKEFGFLRRRVLRRASRL
jgi:hypothetical protein